MNILSLVSLLPSPFHGVCYTPSHPLPPSSTDLNSVMMYKITYAPLFTGSRDSKLALWRIQDDDDEEASISNYITGGGALPSFGHKMGPPVKKRICPTAEKIRALAFNEPGLVSIIFTIFYL